MKKLFTLALVMMMVMLCVPSIIAEETVAFTIWVPEDDGIRNARDCFFWEWCTEKTGIKLEVVGYSSNEQIQLLFADRQFPDMLCGFSVGGSINNIKLAGQDGDMLALKEIIDAYSPTMKAFYEKNTILYESALIDGNLYTLPVQIQEPKNGMRDQWMYVAAWLEEIGKPVPTTMDELMEVLEAIKAAAGTGTIPEDVIPLYTCYDSAVGGQFDILAAFGIVTGTNGEYTMADADGNVVYQAINPDIIPALKWIQEAVQKGLIPMECFTNGWSEYLSYYDSYPPLCFMVTAYSNADTTIKHPMDVPDNGLGRPSYIRAQSKQGGNPKHVFCVFNTDNVQAHVAEIGELIEFWAQPTTAMTNYYGKEEIGIWWQNEDGTYSISPDWNGANYLQNHYLELGPNNRFFCVLSTEFYETQYTDPDLAVENSRGWAYENLYKDNLPTWDPFVYSTTLEEDEQYDLGEYQAVISAHRRTTITRWLTTDADIEAEWAEYIAEMENLGVNEWLHLKQKAYDLATGKK